MMSPTLIFINKNTQERSLIRVVIVEKASVTAQHFVFIREFTWEKNGTSVRSVVRNSVRAHICRLIRKSTL